MSLEKYGFKFVDEDGNIIECENNPEGRKVILDVIDKADDNQLHRICNCLSMFHESQDEIFEFLMYDNIAEVDEEDFEDLFSDTLEAEGVDAVQDLADLTDGYFHSLNGLQIRFPASYTQTLYDELCVKHPDQTGVERAVDLIEGYAAHHDLYAASELL